MPRRRDWGGGGGRGGQEPPAVSQAGDVPWGHCSGPPHAGGTQQPAPSHCSVTANTLKSPPVPVFSLLTAHLKLVFFGLSFDFVFSFD